MRIPVIRGLIDRRILVNFRVDPEALANILPAPFTPKLIHGVGMAGICLIRLKQLRPRLLPAALGISSENAAHRIAVEWEQDATLHEGVYIPRRDSSSRLNTLLGGRLFPGIHHHAHFDVQESDDCFHIVIDGRDGKRLMEVKAHLAAELPDSSVFRSLREASEFFEHGALGYSATGRVGEFDGLELRTFSWQVQPLDVPVVESQFFNDEARFPAGSVTFDCALLMREIEHEWCERPSLCCDGAVA